MKELICIVCPNGCHLKVDEKTLEVSGNNCERGAEYGRTELTNPTRVLTSIVRTDDGRVCSVKTNGAIPKGRIFEAMDVLKPVVLKLPARIGDVVAENVCGTDISWVVTKNME